MVHLSGVLGNSAFAQPPPGAPGEGPPARQAPQVSLVAVRLTEFWDQMRAQFGDTYAESVAKDQVVAELGDRTVNQALADGEDAKTVWRAVCQAFDVPERMR
jgi:hypothetical protein